MTDKSRNNLQEVRAYIPKGLHDSILLLIEQEEWNSTSNFLGHLLVIGLQEYCRRRQAVAAIKQPDLDTDS